MLITTGRALCGAVVVLCGIAPITDPTPALAAERILTNDNRVAAGTLAEGTLTVRLEARTGEWKPDGDDQPGVTVAAFGMEGGALEIPGPLVRVRAGTNIHLVIRNRLDAALEVHGLYSRPATGDPTTLLIPAGESREATFPAADPGTYYYWATTAPGTQMSRRTGTDSQLSGALIVDPAGTEPRTDRILLAGYWNDTVRGSEGARFRFVINGRSWPHTERLQYRVGDPVRLRLINVGVSVHPMHLHGFYFNVNSRGNERADTILPETSDHMAVTERLPSGTTFTLTWIPTRSGNWLFHCHDNVHLQYGGTLDGSPSPHTDPQHHVENHALEMMSGPIIGITVTGTSTDVIPRATQYRKLRLTARVDAGGTEQEPAFAYALEDPAGHVSTPPQLPGPTIVLKRGEPVAITVVNELAEPTTVHWHGIELESYFDGVAGFAGEGTHIAPPIAPGGSFEARFTPPRSGTFIYHTHIDEVRQQQGGLSGPLVVVDDLSTYDPQHDRVVMVTVPRTNPTADVVLINGSPKPALTEMRAGEKYRLRFINLHTFRPNLRMRVLEGTAPRSWRALAKDGRDLPADQAVTGPSEVQMGSGETYDFEFVPTAAGELRLDVANGAGLVLASMPIRVR